MTGEVEIVLNHYMPPTMVAAYDYELTDAEREAIQRAKADARAKGEDETAAGFYALAATGKVRRIMCGTEAHARITRYFAALAGGAKG
jgi:hypothetical protein